MNRVVLSGRLAGRPKLSYTPGGVAVVEFRLLIPRDTRSAPEDPPDDPVDCVAFREDAVELATWGDADYRVNLDGRLRHARYWSLEGRYVEGLRVLADTASFVDPIAVVLGGRPERPPNVPLPVPVPPRGG